MSTTSSDAGRVSSLVTCLRLRASAFIDSVQVKASGMVEAGQAAVHTSRELVDKKVNETLSYAGGRVAAVNDLVSLLHGKVKQAEATVWGVLVTHCEDVKSKGLKSWVVSGASAATLQAQSMAMSLTSNTAGQFCSAKEYAVEHATGAANAAKAKASELGASAREIATDKAVQVSAASAASGAMALGASGGATGLAAGGALGAVAGLVPAIFTFGLSIPIGAAIGGGTGLVVGTAVGGTVGAVGGGAAGYGGYSKKEDIGKCANYVKSKATEATELVKGKSSAAFGRAVEAADFTKMQAYASAEYVAGKASAAKLRLVGRSGTGGTETAD